MSESNSALLIKRMSAFNATAPATHREFVSEMVHAARREHDVWMWSGEARSGEPITVVWVTGSRSGRVLTAFELPGGE